MGSALPETIGRGPDGVGGLDDDDASTGKLTNF